AAASSSAIVPAIDPPDPRGGRSPLLWTHESRALANASADLPASNKKFSLAPDERDLRHVDGLGAEAGLEIGQVEFPHAPEAGIEAHRRDLRPGTEEALAPFGERARVIEAEEILPRQLEPGACDLAAQDAHRRQHAARENIALDEIDALAIARIPM